MNDIYRGEIRANADLHLVLTAHISSLKNHCESELRQIERIQAGLQAGSSHVLPAGTPNCPLPPQPPTSLPYAPSAVETFASGRNTVNSGVLHSNINSLRAAAAVAASEASSMHAMHQKSPSMAAAASYLYQQQVAANNMYQQVLQPGFRNFEDISPPAVSMLHQMAAGVAAAQAESSGGRVSFPYGSTNPFLEIATSGRYHNPAFTNSLPPGANNLRLS